MPARGKSELRFDDNRLSNQIYGFLDKTFYSNEVSDFERVTDTARQVKGLDVIFNIGDTKYFCDEKAAVRYRNLETFSLELSFIDASNKVRDGWLIDDKHINDSFLFVWIDEDNNGESVQIALVKKSKILNYLDDLGWSKSRLIEKSRAIRAGDPGWLGNTRTAGYKFTFSERFVEQPINIILPRATYLRLAHKVWNSKLI